MDGRKVIKAKPLATVREAGIAYPKRWEVEYPGILPPKDVRAVPMARERSPKNAD